MRQKREVYHLGLETPTTVTRDGERAGERKHAGKKMRKKYKNRNCCVRTVKNGHAHGLM